MPRRIRKPSGNKRIDRNAETKNIKQHYLIVCEGEKTELLYFNAFPQPPTEIGSIKVEGTGYNTDSLVKKTITLKAKLERKNRRRFSRVWCVFDRDSFPSQNYNLALELAKREGFCVACTNNAFEMWYLMHFSYYDAAISRHEYERILSEREQLGFPYDKADPHMYNILLDKQAIAIQNAKRLYATYGKNPKLEICDPITLVHKLVDELNDLSRLTIKQLKQFNPKCPKT